MAKIIAAVAAGLAVGTHGTIGNEGQTFAATVVQNPVFKMHDHGAVAVYPARRKDADTGVEEPHPRAGQPVIDEGKVRVRYLDQFGLAGVKVIDAGEFTPAT